MALDIKYPITTLIFCWTNFRTNMATKGEPTAYYYHLPPSPDPHHQQRRQQQQQYIILPLYSPPSLFGCLRRRLFCFASLILFAIAVFLLWPSDPDLNVVRIRLQHVRLHTLPSLSLDISLALTIKVRNKDFFSLDYRSLVVSIGYRGNQLGFVTSNEGHLRARGSSYVNATLQLDAVDVLFDAFYFLEDLAKGSIPFDTVTEVQGKLGLLFFEIPLKAKVSCVVYVNMDGQTITRQDCYPE